MISFESFTYDNEEFEGILSYGEEKIFTDLPYDEVQVDYSLVDYDYYMYLQSHANDANKTETSEETTDNKADEVEDLDDKISISLSI